MTRTDVFLFESALEAAELVRSKKVSSQELTEAVLGRIEPSTHP